ncbi:MAG: AMP-binding protein, partial [Nocardioidaceae bacterium]
MAAHADREALVEAATGRRWTYAEFDTDVTTVARGLISLGIDVGDRVGIWAPNCAEWTLVQYATAKIGAILVNINPAYRTHELAYALNQSGVRLLISAQKFKSSHYRAMIDEVRPDSTTLEQVMFLGSADWEQLVAAANDVPAERVAERMAGLSPTDPINIQYT